MKLSDIFNAKAIALNYTEDASNREAYLGEGLFPNKKKAGLDLKWIKGHKGLPVSLMPSNFDAKATIRDRVGVTVTETQMAFFRESMLIKEKDRQEILRVKESADPYASAVLDSIFDDARILIDGADVVSERMRMQLLAPLGGTMGIAISANGVDYTYNYDPDGSWRAKHYAAISSANDKWNAPSTCDPLSDLEQALDAQETASGNRPEVVLMSKGTFDMIRKADKTKDYILSQNVTANVLMTKEVVKTALESILNVSIVVYNKKFKKEDGTVQNFFPDGIVTLIPRGNLGSTYYGTTPEEADLESGANIDLSLVNTGVSVATITIPHPVNIQTIVSEIVLPSFEAMDSCYSLEVV